MHINDKLKGLSHISLKTSGKNILINVQQGNLHTLKHNINFNIIIILISSKIVKLKTNGNNISFIKLNNDIKIK